MNEEIVTLATPCLLTDRSGGSVLLIGVDGNDDEPDVEKAFPVGLFPKYFFTVGCIGG